MMAKGGFVELFARTNFSFLRAASSPEAVVKRAAEIGYDRLGVADCDGLYGMVRAHEEASRNSVRLVVGCELTLGAAPPHAFVTVHVENAAGYSNLCRVLTESHRLHPKGEPRARDEGVARNCYAGAPVDFLCEHADGLWCAAHDDVSERDLRALRDASASPPIAIWTVTISCACVERHVALASSRLPSSPRTPSATRTGKGSSSSTCFIAFART